MSSRQGSQVYNSQSELPRPATGPSELDNQKDTSEPTDDEVNAAIDALAEKAQRHIRGTSGNAWLQSAAITNHANLLKRALASPAPSPVSAWQRWRAIAHDFHNGLVGQGTAGAINLELIERASKAFDALVEEEEGTPPVPLSGERET